MTDVLFYHLERARVETVLPDLLEKSLEKGWRSLVKTSSAERVAAIDTHLWVYKDESFIPHGRVGEDDTRATSQPVWISNADDNPNGANVLFLIDGALRDAADLQNFERCVLIFDGGDDDAVQDARNFWKSVKEAGLSSTYWKQSDSGRFEKMA